MTSDKQVQKAGDGSIQYQIGTIVTGIDEKRAREVYSEMSEQTLAQCAAEALTVADKRIEAFKEVLIPRMEAVEKNFESFCDPSFQVLLKKAQLSAACTGKTEDYSILSELLVHRINNKNNVKKKASIAKAIEIIDQIDDDSLMALSVLHAINTIRPVSGGIVFGLTTLSSFYEKILYQQLPLNNDLWIDNLLILGTITILPLTKSEDLASVLARRLSGYVCVGIKKDSNELEQARKCLEEANLSQGFLVDHELLDGYVRLAITQLDDLGKIKITRSGMIDGVSVQINDCAIIDNERKCLENIISLYSKNEQLLQQVNEAFRKLLTTFTPIKQLADWWDHAFTSITLTSVGSVLAHTNAKRIDSRLPDMD